MKYLIYQQGARGLGRITRSIKFCNVLKELDPEYSALIVASDPIVASMDLPGGTEVISLPRISKLLQPEFTSVHLGLPLEQMTRLRSEVLLGYVKGFRPDVVVVDTIPTGVHGELIDAIRWVKAKLPGSQVLYITRDVLGDPAEVIATWRPLGVHEFLQEYIDRILVFGESVVFDYADSVCFPDALRAKTFYCGFFDTRFSPGIGKHYHEAEQSCDVLVTVGGGVDGAQVIDQCLSMLAASKTPRSATFVLGHQMSDSDRNRVHTAAASQPSVRVRDFHPCIPRLISASAVTISMAGANTVGELLASKARALLIPRVWPTTEQLLRVERMQALGWFRFLHPNGLNAQALGEAIEELLTREPTREDVGLDFDTARRVYEAMPAPVRDALSYRRPGAPDARR